MLVRAQMLNVGKSSTRDPYRADSEFLLRFKQEDALVDGPDRTHGAWVSLETKRGLLRRKTLERGELQRHLQGGELLVWVQIG